MYKNDNWINNIINANSKYYEHVLWLFFNHVYICSCIKKY